MRRGAAAAAVLLAACSRGVAPPPAVPSPAPATSSPSPSSPSPSPRASAPPVAVVPVLLVHGYGGVPAEMETLAARVRAAGRDAVLVALPRNGAVAIPESAAALHAAALRTRAPKVDVVGFSLGGVVARAWATGAGRSYARRVVQLGSPNAGVVVDPVHGPCAPDNACGQLRPGSAFLAALARARVPAGVRVTSIWSTYDRLVRPESARLPGGVPLQSVCAGDRSGHLDLLTEPVAAGAVVVALEGRTPLSYRCAELGRRGRG